MATRDRAYRPQTIWPGFPKEKDREALCEFTASGLYGRLQSDPEDFIRKWIAWSFAARKGDTRRDHPSTGHLGLGSSKFWKIYHFSDFFKRHQVSIYLIIMSNDTNSLIDNENIFDIFYFERIQFVFEK